MEVLHLNTKQFEELLNSGEKFLADFWAPWCGPCKMLGPQLDEAAKEVSIKIVKINVDEESDLAARYNVQSIPTLILFENGQQVKRDMGYRPKAEIIKFIG